MSETQYDLIVIGAGPGGYTAAARAGELGMKVACVDKSALGGTCLNVGCIPSKALLESSELYHKAQSGLGEHGIVAGDVQFDLSAMMQRKDKIVATMTKGIEALFKARGVTPYTGAATLLGEGRVAVEGAAGAQELQAKHILLATGSAPAELPSLPFDGQHIVSSTEALAFDRVPKRMVVIGAGAIGLEMGSVWSRLGSEVVVVEFMEHILPGMDVEMAGQLGRLLKRQGLDIRLQTGAKGFTLKKKAFTKDLKN